MAKNYNSKAKSADSKAENCDSTAENRGFLKREWLNLISLLLAAIALVLSSVISFRANNISIYAAPLNYTYETLKFTSARPGGEFTVAEEGITNQNYSVGVNLPFTLSSGQINSIYVCTVYGNQVDNFMLLNEKPLKARNSFQLEFSIAINAQDADGWTEIPLYFLVVDNQGQIYIDFYQFVCKDVLAQNDSGFSINLNPQYAYRVIKYNQIISAQDVEGKAWDMLNVAAEDEGQLRSFPLSQQAIIQASKLIRAHYNEVYS